MKLLYSLLFTLFISLPAFGQSCLPDGIVLDFQSDVDQFFLQYQNCKEIIGDLEIKGVVNDISKLSNLERIGGNLLINTSQLGSLQGLENISSIGGDLIIRTNGGLSSLEGLEGLVSIGGMLSIENCVGLYNLKGLDNLSTVNRITIDQNTSLENIELESLGYLPGNLEITNQNNLANISLNTLLQIGGDLLIEQSFFDEFTGFQNLRSVDGYFIIRGTYFETPIQGLAAIDSISKGLVLENCLEFRMNSFFNELSYLGGDISFKDNDFPNDLIGFQKLESISGSIILNNNAGIPLLGGFENLGSCESIEIIDNIDLISIDGFNNLNSIDAHFLLFNNNFIESLKGFNSLKSIGTDLQIEGADELRTLEAFDSLNSIGGEFILNRNFHLEDIYSIRNLRSVGGITISGFEQLKNLDSLNKFDPNVLTTLTINDNYELAVCHNEAVCNFLEIETGFIERNKEGCDTEQEVRDFCFQVEFSLNISTFIDENWDGSRDANEQEFPSARVLLNSFVRDTLPSNQTHIVDRGNYVVDHIPIADWELTTQDSYVADLNDSNPTENIEFGVRSAFFCVVVNVFNDTNENGVWDTDETFEPSGTITIDNVTYSSGDTLKLREGSYSASFMPGVDLLPTSSSMVDIDLYELPQIRNVNFGVRTALKKVEVIVYSDWNRNGIRNSIDTIISSGQIKLGNQIINSGETINLRIGNHLFEYIQDSDWILTTDPMVDLQIDSFAQNITVSFGVRSAWHNVLVTAFNDLDIDGVKDRSESLSSLGRIEFDNQSYSSGDTLRLYEDDYSFEYFPEQDWVLTTDSVVTIQLEDEPNFTEVLFGIRAVEYFELGVTVFIDINENGVFDRDEPVDPDASAQIENMIVFSGSRTIVKEGNYEVILNPKTDWYLTTDSIVNVSFSLGDNAKFVSFGISSDMEISNLYQCVGGRARCNTIQDFQAYLENRGSSSPSGTIWVEIDSNATVERFYDTPTFNQGDTLFGWNFNNLSPGAVVFPMFSVDIAGPPDIMVGDSVKMKSYVTYEDSNGKDTTDIFDYCEEIRCSYDPNDKMVLPNRPDKYTLFDQELVYTIRFQNTGNDTAYDITIRDTLDVNLDPSSFRLVTSSHEDVLNVTLTENQFLTFSFPNIFLPDSTTNLQGSNGYVLYTINPANNLAEFTPINNTAHIYFDSNPPIVTNTTESIMVSQYPTSNTRKIDNEIDVKIYPNPTSGKIFFEGDNLESAIVRLSDLTGRILLTEKLNSRNFLQLSTETKGLLILKIETEEGIAVKRIVKY